MADEDIYIGGKQLLDMDKAFVHKADQQIADSLKQI